MRVRTETDSLGVSAVLWGVNWMIRSRDSVSPAWCLSNGGWEQSPARLKLPWPELTRLPSLQALPAAARARYDDGCQYRIHLVMSLSHVVLTVLPVINKWYCNINCSNCSCFKQNMKTGLTKSHSYNATWVSELPTAPACLHFVPFHTELKLDILFTIIRQENIHSRQITQKYFSSNEQNQLVLIFIQLQIFFS